MLQKVESAYFKTENGSERKPSKALKGITNNLFTRGQMIAHIDSFYYRGLTQTKANGNVFSFDYVIMLGLSFRFAFPPGCYLPSETKIEPDLRLPFLNLQQ